MVLVIVEKAVGGCPILDAFLKNIHLVRAVWRGNGVRKKELNLFCWVEVRKE